MRGFNRYAESKFGRKYVHGTVERISGNVGVQGTDSGRRKLTAGKKKLAIYEEDVQRILVRLGEARMDFIRLEKADEQAFRPLSEVYRVKADTEEEKRIKDERMEECLKAAAKVPVEVMERAVSVMDDMEFLALHGSRLAVSDAGVMSVYINTKMMKDREYAETVNSQAELLIKKGTEQADRIYEIVLKAVRG